MGSPPLRFSPPAIAHLSAQPEGLRRSRYTVRSDDQPLGRIELRVRDEGTLYVGDVPFALGSARNRFVLLFEGVEIARAVQPSIWKRRFVVTVNGAMLDFARRDALDARLALVARHPFTRAFDLREGPMRVGTLRPRRIASWSIKADLPDFLPPAAHLFLLSLVVIQWRRAARAASG